MKLSSKYLRALLRMIEIDDGTIDGLRILVGDQRHWFFRAAAGKLKALSEDERGRAAYIFCRLSAPKDLPSLTELAVADSPLVRGNAIAAMGQFGDRAVSDSLLKLLTDSSRPLIDRLQVARILCSRIDDKGIELLKKLDLDNEPEELQYGIQEILEEHRARRPNPLMPD